MDNLKYKFSAVPYIDAKCLGLTGVVQRAIKVCSLKAVKIYWAVGTQSVSEQIPAQ